MRTADGFKLALHELMETARCRKKQTQDIAAFFSITYDESLTLSPSASSALKFATIDMILSQPNELHARSSRRYSIDANPRSSKYTLGAMFSTRKSAMPRAPSPAQLTLDNLLVDADDASAPLSADLDRVVQLLSNDPSKLDPAKAKKLTRLLKEIQQDYDEHR